MSEIVENLPIQIKCAQYYMMIDNCTFNYYEHIKSIIENLFLS